MYARRHVIKKINNNNDRQIDRSEHRQEDLQTDRYTARQMEHGQEDIQTVRHTARWNYVFTHKSKFIDMERDVLTIPFSVLLPPTTPTSLLYSKLYTA